MRERGKGCGGRVLEHSRIYSNQLKILSMPRPGKKGVGAAGADLLGGVAYMLLEHDTCILLLVRVVKDVDPVRLSG